MESREASGAPPSHTGMMFSAHHHNSVPHMMSPNSSSAIPNARFAFNSTAMAPPVHPQVMTSSKPSESSFGGSSTSDMRPSGFAIEPSSSGKKKRGRPRKYPLPPDGNIALALSPTPVHSGDHGDSGGVPSLDNQAKKRRGRPPGSGKKQLNALGVSGASFTPHVIMVDAGEDIASKIMAFSQQGPRTVCILAANGSICNVALLQPTLSGGSVTYKGRFEIISLSGSFSPTENKSSPNRIGGLRVSLAGLDGQVLGGGVAGRLLAATPAHVIVGSFIADRNKTNAGLSESRLPSAAPPQTLTFGAQAAKSASPPSQVALSESFDEDDDGNNSNNNTQPPLNHGLGSYNNASQQPTHGLSMYSSMGWANSTTKTN